LVIGVLRPDSPYVGTTVAVSGRQLGGGDANVVAILRGEHVIVPNATTELQAGDTLMVVVSLSAAEHLHRNLALW
jgi:Trk K+ transport system NAD-binding subunit